MSGLELNPESYAICKADMLIKGQDITMIVQGNTLSDDGYAYLVASRIDPASRRLSRSCCVRPDNAAVSTSYAMRWPMPTRAVGASSPRRPHNVSGEFQIENLVHSLKLLVNAVCK